MSNEYLEYIKKVESYFVESNRVATEREVIILSSGKYELIIDKYKPRPEVKYVEVTRGIVKTLEEDIVIADIKRRVNYFFYYWIAHPNNNEYLICAESYWEYMVINLSTRKTSLSFMSRNEEDKNAGLIWHAVYPSPDKLVIAVRGCVWGYGEEVRFYDFSNPDNIPLQELGRSRERNSVSIMGWKDNDTFVYSAERWRRASDNKRVEELSNEEIQELDDDPEDDLSIYIEETVEWKRSTAITI